MVGEGLLAPDRPLKPRIADFPAAMILFRLPFLMLIMAPCAKKVPFHTLVMLCVEVGKGNINVHKFTSLDPVLLIVMFAVKPPCH